MSEPSYQFLDVEYPTRTAMLDGIALAWITGDGRDPIDSHYARIKLAEDPEALARRCVNDWELNDHTVHDEPGEVPHMEEHGYTVADLAAAFARVKGAAS